MKDESFYPFEFELSDIDGDLRVFAEIIGIDALRKLVEEYCGTVVYFPTERRFYQPFVNRCIVHDATYNTPAEIAKKYKVSLGHVHKLLKLMR